MADSHNPTPATSLRGNALTGIVTVPGDKSISHRALMLGSQVIGRVTVSGLLEGEDVLRTADALRNCGVAIERLPDGSWQVDGVGVNGLSEPTDVLDMGNSGTGVRLMMGLVAPYPFSTVFTGDESLRKRPMGRVTTPLGQMGARFSTREGGRLPLTMEGSDELLPITYELPVASAQVKSAILLAGLGTPGITTVIEKEATRDHTERMLRYFGFHIETESHPDGGCTIRLHGQPKQERKNHHFTVPSDPSSAAFPMVAAMLVPGSHITLKDVCINPLRTGLFDTLKEMGADIQYESIRDVAGETVADIAVKHSPLEGVTVPAARAPSMIDEYPILAIAAACARGRTVMQGLAELRVKESNRLSAILEGLKTCGVECYEEGDNLIVQGGTPKGGATITTHYDHRIAMSFLVLGLVAESSVTVDDTRAIATSFPNFIPLMQQLGASLDSPTVSMDAPLIIAVDGPAASGKGTLARRLADHYGIAYLDTGSLYRAAAMRLVYAGMKPDNVAAAIAAARAIQPHDIANPKLRQQHIGEAASVISAYPEVREALLEYQRNFAHSGKGAVLDGRDIGTVVCPEAQIKLFITASLETRAERRHREVIGEGFDISLEAVQKELSERDERDMKRKAAPLKPADDAIQLDTSNLTADAVLQHALELLKAKLGR